MKEDAFGPGTGCVPFLHEVSLSFLVFLGTGMDPSLEQDAYKEARTLSKPTPCI